MSSPPNPKGRFCASPHPSRPGIPHCVVFRKFMLMKEGICEDLAVHLIVEPVLEFSGIRSMPYRPRRPIPITKTRFPPRTGGRRRAWSGRCRRRLPQRILKERCRHGRGVPHARRVPDADRLLSGCRPCLPTRFRSCGRFSGAAPTASPSPTESSYTWPSRAIQRKNAEKLPPNERESKARLNPRPASGIPSGKATDWHAECTTRLSKPNQSITRKEEGIQNPSGPGTT